MKLTKLYDIPRNSRIGISHLELEIDGKMVHELNFERIDGIFSVCTDDNGDLIQLSCMTDVQFIKSLL